MTATIVSLILRRPIAAAIALTLGLGLVPQLAAAQPMDGIAMIGDPALPDGFDLLPYEQVHLYHRNGALAGNIRAIEWNTDTGLMTVRAQTGAPVE